MIGERVRPLYAVLVLGAVVCLARLWQVQVREHELWASEAARLVSFGRVLPYRRGVIRTSDGTLLAKDKETHHLVVVYRRFRRGHPLGIVAHARSLVEGRAVPLPEALDELERWAHELVLLSPAELEAFARGGPLATASLRLPAAVDARAEGRRRRAADLRFYVRRLLRLSPREWLALWREVEPEETRTSFLALAARRAGRPPELVQAELDGRLAKAREHLGRLARRLGWPEEEVGSDAPRDPVRRLVVELELARRWVEDAAASKLFVEATGFAPGRVAPHVLRAFFELDWIRRLFVWDEARLVEWTETARRSWLESWRDGYALPRLVAALRLDPAVEPGPDDVLDHLAALFAPEGAVEAALDGSPVPWRGLDAPVVFDQLEGLFRAELPDDARALARGALPFQAREARALRPPPSMRWSLVDAALAEPPERPTTGERVQRLLAQGDRRAGDELFALARWIVDGWEERFQSALLEALVAIRRDADPERDCSPRGRLVVEPDRRERAVERADFYLKDYGMRPRPLVPGEPDYDVIYLLTRYEEHYAGFEAREARERVYPTVDEAGGHLLGKLLGHVSTVNVEDLQRQRAEAHRLRELRDLPQRSSDEERELLRLVGRVLLHDEVRGVSGVEGFWDPELVGRNGYFESRGLQDLEDERAQRLVREAVDGEDLVLTVHAGLQAAAQRTLRHPEPVPGDPEYDWRWQGAPVGAIVWITPEGDVLAAASEPDEASDVGPGAPAQRSLCIDRTLRAPTFQPAGSVFKPFLAAWALDHGLDPRRTVLCGPLEGRAGAGYVDVRCHAFHGHGELALDDALVRSCNAYFAWLGESLAPGDLHALAPAFGFGRPTGVRTPPPWDSGVLPRGGLREDVPVLFQGRLGDFERRLAGNGLGLVEATPMQIARATAGLATGRLPSLRLVAAAGGRPVPPVPSQPLAVGADSLERVRAALRDVVARSDGTAHRALAGGELGFAVAAKTGSADLVGRSDEDDARERRVRKHTWVAGWVPAEDPVAVFVVFMHDTRSTSSHGAVYLARQLLGQPETRGWLAEHGVGGAGAGGAEEGPGDDAGSRTVEAAAERDSSEDER